MRGLYAIVDTAACERSVVDPVAFAEVLLTAEVAALQLRAKGWGAGRTLALLRELAPRCRAAGVPLFANDRPDLALLAGCHGVHVGQADPAPADVRSLSAGADRRLLVGLSTHDEAQLDSALSAPIDYVALGPVFPTANKQAPEPTLGLELALALAARAKRMRPELPRVAIGGVDEHTLPLLVPSFDLVAVIGALLPARLTGDAALRGARDAAEALARIARAPVMPEGARA